MWCSECKSYAHITSEIPLWWENAEFVDESQLCAEPEHLENMSTKTDEWLNKLISSTEYFDDINVCKKTLIVKLKTDFCGIAKGTLGTLPLEYGRKVYDVEFINKDGSIIGTIETPGELLELVEEK